MKGNIIACIKVAIISFWIFVIGIVAGTYLPHNPFTPTGKTKIYLKSILPEGWGFFTRDPQEPAYYLFSKIDGKWQSVLRSPNAASDNLLGLQRNSRAQGYEYGRFLSQISTDSAVWGKCKNLTLSECLNQNEDFKSVEVKNVIENPTLCGDIWVVMRRPIPWAWYKDKKNINMPMRFIRINVICEK